MSTAEHIAKRYIAVWNETDAARRASMLHEDWADGVTYVDPMAAAVGQADIDTLIANVQQRFPDFRFALTGEPNGYGNYVRFSWSLGASATKPQIEGSDVVVTDDGRIARVIGFLDTMPSAI